jgi:hypothetical protein
MKASMLLSNFKKSALIQDLSCTQRFYRSKKRESYLKIKRSNSRMQCSRNGFKDYASLFELIKTVYA